MFVKKEESCYPAKPTIIDCPLTGHKRKALKANRLTVNSQDLWLAKDNRFLNPKISYERILMAPPCRLISLFLLLIRADGAINPSWKRSWLTNSSLDSTSSFFLECCQLLVRIQELWILFLSGFFSGLYILGPPGEGRKWAKMLRRVL